MDGNQFDALARTLGSALSRRGALFAVAAGIAAGLLGSEDADTARGGKNRHRPGQKHGGEKRGRAKRRSREHNRVRDGHQTDGVENEATCYKTSTCTVADRANLARCNFANATVFRNASCLGCNLSKANLSGADLRNAKLASANLGDACLVGADLTGASLSQANTRGAVFCRTRMPNGTLNNGGCNAATSCCPTCLAIGASCGTGIGGACCGGANCVDGFCACPRDKPRNCDGACQQCCDDAECGGDAPRCCNGSCRRCCNGDDCPSGVCCGNACCPAGQICDSREGANACCVPESRDAVCGVGTARPRCGTVTDTCGQRIDCGRCAEDVCRDATCNNENRCVYDVSRDGVPGTSCATICCSGVCCPTENDVCVAAGTDSGGTAAQPPVCCTPESIASTCAGKCGRVVNSCGQAVECPNCANPTPVCGSDSTCRSCQDRVECGPGQVCCGGSCFSGACCGDDECGNPNPICRSNVCAACQVHQECGAGRVCCDGACQACCGADPSTCPPAGVCENAICTSGSCATAPATGGACLRPDGTTGSCCSGACCASGEVCHQDACCRPTSTCPAHACGAFADGCGGQFSCTCPSGESCFGGLCRKTMGCTSQNLCTNEGFPSPCPAYPPGSCFQVRGGPYCSDDMRCLVTGSPPRSRSCTATSCPDGFDCVSLTPGCCYAPEYTACVRRL